jgi:plastocyanin
MSTTYDQVYGESNTFSPAAVTIARNGTVTWTNATGTAHNVTFAGTGAPANIANYSTGSNARTFATAGTFSYQCTNHSGMTGSVTVQ